VYFVDSISHYADVQFDDNHNYIIQSCDYFDSLYTQNVCGFHNLHIS